MRKMLDELHEIVTYMFALFMGGLVIVALIAPCFLP